MVVLDTKLSTMQNLLGKKLSADELAQALADVGFELDESQGDTIKIDITPDRIDALSPLGLARILKSYAGLTKKPKQYQSKPNKNYRVIVEPSVSQVRPHTVCAVVKGLTLGDEEIKQIIWIQEKLHSTLGKNRKRAALGVYPLDKISWPVTFCAKKPADISFQPLDAVSFMTAKQILERHPTGMEYAHLLADLSTYPVFVDNNNQILSMPPVINSQTVGKVTSDTEDIFIEVSGFDETLLSNILTLVVCFLSDMGGTIYDVEVNYGKKRSITPRLNYEDRKISCDAVINLSGLDLSSKEIAANLNKMAYTITKIENNAVKFQVPPYRLDIWHDVDVIDDVVRAYGINNVHPVVPQIATVGGLLYTNRFQQQLSQLLVNAGCVEVKTLAVTDKLDQFEKMNSSNKPHIALGSTAERNINMLRCALLPELLKFFSNNASAPYPQNIFEIGDVVIPDETSDVKAKNLAHASFALCHESANFTLAKQTLESVLYKVGIKPTYKALKHDSFIEGRCAVIIINGTQVGYFGEIHPQVLQNWKLEVPIAACELCISTILEAIEQKTN